MKHLCFDIETKLNEELCGATLADQEEFAKREFDWDGTEEDFPFLPLHYHLPWITCWSSFDDRTGETKSGVLMGDEATSLLQAKGARLVTFNGRRFDVPILEIAAFRDQSFKDTTGWFKNTGPAYKQARNRYNTDRHWDVYEFSTNFNAASTGTLDQHAYRLGIDGKENLEHPFHRLFWEAPVDDVIKYCHKDVLITWKTYLRQLELTGVVL